ncbi:DegT/DnrJ/EryC1/StrS family aminotransferase [Paenibacillus beijingensis]|uniref:Aminotransferase n=1 Tax=Paenibacillus beijingensis TaxID=1126833 RepID=A0A0D5NMQ3_9BACL|nr:DegT/DnrJ/EryC1/StrS family aminotransferase [Paenibacillus beijingensis]AJY76267.1 hypothetical protein VN24_19010 [Paenibacillus beijingensis]
MYRIGQEEIDAVTRVINSKELFRINDKGREVENFEKEFERKLGIEYSLALSGGGTSALIAALVGLEIGPGDEVLVPSYTFVSTAIAVLAVGAIPVIVEIDDSLTICTIDMEKKISPYTKAVIPVHMRGFPCNMERIEELAKLYNLRIIEDVCQAVGGSFRGERLGTIGDAGAFSFNQYKIISSGEGGAMVTSLKEVYERALIYHDVGSGFREFSNRLKTPIFAGVQYRASEIMGAILREQLKRLDGILEDLRNIKKRIMNELSTESDINFIKSYDDDGDCGTTVGLLFLNEECARKFASSKGVNGWLPIDTGKHVYTGWQTILEKRGSHHPLMNPYKRPENQNLNMSYSKEMCPQTLDILSRTVLLVIHPDLNEEDVTLLIKSCREAAKQLIKL